VLKFTLDEWPLTQRRHSPLGDYGRGHKESKNAHMSGEPIMSDDEITKYPGDSAEVSWHGNLCIHIGECGRAKGDLFVGGRQPWCQPDVASNDEVKDVVMRCPTGALSVKFADGSVPEKASPENTVNVAYNGPLFVRGQLNIDGAPSNAPGLNFRTALCRCGQSKNKPFCDNSHDGAGFRDYGAVGETGEPCAETVLPERYGSIEHPSKQIECSSSTTQQETEKNARL